MKRRLGAALAVAGCLAIGFTTTVSGQGKGKPTPANVPVTSQLLDGNGVSSFELRSDTLGPYITGSGVLSQIWSNGDWELDLSQQTVRGVDLTLIPTGSSPSPLVSGRYYPRMISRCFSADGGVTGYLLIPEGGSNSRCAMRLNFTSGGIKYFLVMSPLYSGTTWVTVSCPADADVNTTCESWSASPDPDVAAPVAALYRVDKFKETFIGTYVLNFALAATR